jgi:outer membrane biogenesis lipoprotein LolB
MKPKHPALCTLNSALCTLNSALCTLNSALLTLCLSLFLSACAARTPPRPVGAPTPDPAAAEAFTAATASCKGFRSIEGELALSGRAGEERVRGRVLTGLEPGGAVRLEAVAPFGAPFFILAGRNERATLVLPRERRVLADTGVREVLERITGLALGADDLRLIMSGCLVENAVPSDGRQWGNEWKAVTVGPERVAYLRMQGGKPVLIAADYGAWHLDYSAHAAGFPRVVRVRRAGDNAIDITARIEQLQVNTQINPLAWTVDVPPGADPMTLDELRSIAPLAESRKGGS